MLKPGKIIFRFALVLKTEPKNAEIKEHEKTKRDCRGTKNCFIKTVFLAKKPNEF